MFRSSTPGNCTPAGGSNTPTTPSTPLSAPGDLMNQLSTLSKFDGMISYVSHNCSAGTKSGGYKLFVQCDVRYIFKFECFTGIVPRKTTSRVSTRATHLFESCHHNSLNCPPLQGEVEVLKKRQIQNKTPTLLPWKLPGEDVQ